MIKVLYNVFTDPNSSATTLRAALMALQQFGEEVALKFGCKGFDALSHFAIKSKILALMLVDF